MLYSSIYPRFSRLWHFVFLVFSSSVVPSLAFGQDRNIALRGRVLDSGCGGGGTVVAVAEEVDRAVGLDLDARFRDAGTRLAAEKGCANARFVQGDGLALPFADDSFDLVLSHSVIEHVRSPQRYLGECARVLRRARATAPGYDAATPSHPSAGSTPPSFSNADS